MFSFKYLIKYVFTTNCNKTQKQKRVEIQTYVSFIICFKSVKNKISNISLQHNLKNCYYAKCENIAYEYFIFVIE